MSAPPLLDEWLERLKSSEPLDLAELGHAAVPELIAAYTPDGFEIHVLPGSTLWIVDGLVVADLTAELDPVSPSIGGTGVIQRRIDMTQGRAYHFKFELPEAAQGQGRGRRVLRRSVDLYSTLGIDEIHLTAVDTGRYVWAAAGFSFSDEESRHEVVRGVELAADLLGLPIFDLDAESVEPWQIAFMPPVEDLTLREALETLDPEGLEALGDSADNLDEPLNRPGKLLLMADEVPGWRGKLELRPSNESPGLELLYAYTD